MKRSYCSRRRLAPALLLMSLALSACSGPHGGGGPGSGSGSGSGSAICPASSLRAASPPVCPIGGPPQPSAALPHNALPHNNLTASALAGNYQLLLEMTLKSLGRSLFSDTGVNTPVSGPQKTWADVIGHEHAPELMKYIVSCALDPCDVIEVPPGPAFDEVRLTNPDGFRGELGLCRNSSPTGDWTTSGATPECFEKVTACVLARVNQVGKRVMISMRGDGLTLKPQVQVETSFRENGGTPIASFQGCDKKCLWGHPIARNCDWEPRHVGLCENQMVSGVLQVKNVTVAMAGARIRICEGIHGCDDVSTPGAGAETTPQPPPGDYGGTMIGQALDTVTFPCPLNGPSTQAGRAGYYSVMVASPTPGTPLPNSVDVAANSGTYPAAEEQVFTFQEGAFYGNLFALPFPTASAVCPGTEWVFPREQFVCTSSIWSPGMAKASGRFCAVPNSNCFVNEPLECDVGVSADCDVEAPVVAGREVYESCKSANSTWQWPYTTYLNHPCDLYPSRDACKPFLTIDTQRSAFLAPGQQITYEKQEPR